MESMDSDPLPILTSNIDKSQVPPIHQKRIVAFVNHFIINTVTFLNKFVVNCETKFIDFESKLHKVEASLLILEAKLASTSSSSSGGTTDNTNINLNPSSSSSSAATITTAPSSSSTPVEITSTQPSSKDTVDPGVPSHDPTDLLESNQNANNVPTNEKSSIVGIKACDDVRYRKYFKMIQFGVPIDAVKQKMEAEHIDSHILDEPNRMLEDGIPYCPPSADD